MSKMKKSDFQEQSQEQLQNQLPAGPTPEPIIHAKDVFDAATPDDPYGESKQDQDRTKPDSKPTHLKLYRVTRNADGVVFWLDERQAKEFQSSPKFSKKFTIEPPAEDE